MKSFRNVVLTAFFAFPTGSACFSQPSYDRSRLTDLFQNDDYESAIELLRSLPQAASNPQYQSDLGYALYMNREFAEAKTVFNAIFQQEAGNIRANLFLARINEELGRPDSALFHYNQLTRLAPYNFRHWQKATQLYSDLGFYDSALVCVQNGFRLNQASGPLAVQYANALVRLKQPAPADSVITAFLSRDSSNREVIAKKTDLAFRKPDYPQVIRWAEKLLNDSADLTVPYINLAYSYLNMDSIDRSIWVCEWLIGKNKAYPQILYCAALAYGRKKDFVKSNEYLDKCIELSIQKEALTYFNAKSDNYEEMKLYKQASAYHDTAYYIFHAPLDLYYTGRLYDKYLKNPVKAAYYYRQFIARRKRPASNEEARIFQYIEMYLQEQPGKKGAVREKR